MKIIDLVEGNEWESGGDGYIFKAGQGGHEYNWRPFVALAEAEGKPWGLYWVSDSRYAPEYHKAAIKTAFPTGYFGVLGLWLDIEKPWIGMTDFAYRQTPYPYYKPVESLWRGVFLHTGVYPGMYFGPGTWDLIMSGAPAALQQEFADKCDCWIAHYTRLPAPDMRGKWVSWALWQWREGPDYNRVNIDWWMRVTANLPPAPVVFHVKRPRAEVELYITPGGDEYPLKPILKHAAENGWMAAINCGAGFDYTDAYHAYMRTAGFQSIQVANGKVFYARHMIAGGVINSELNTEYKAPWTMLGFDATTVHLIVTKGQEGGEGMTQMEAAQWAQARGILDCYLMDSGHSSGIVENGTLLYSAYGDAIPQCLGLKSKITGGTMIKGTCKAGLVANIKNMTTGAILHQLGEGESVYGEWSTTKTDIIEFTHYYTATGLRIHLGVFDAMCKVSIGANLTITENVTEPGDVIPPPPSAPPSATTKAIELVDDGVTWKGTLTRQ